MAPPSSLEGRMPAMRNPRLNRQALSRRATAATAITLLLVTLPIAAFGAGQSAPASLAGSVYDRTGAVLPAVELTLEDATHLTWTATSDGAGRFVFPGVQPGRYVLAASLAGLRQVRHEFELRTTRDWDRAVTLQVGDVQETITVRETRVAAPGPPSQPQGAQPVRVGGNIRVPRKEFDVRPVYPAAMREAGREAGRATTPHRRSIGTRRRSARKNWGGPSAPMGRSCTRLCASAIRPSWRMTRWAAARLRKHWAAHPSRFGCTSRTATRCTTAP